MKRLFPFALLASLLLGCDAQEQKGSSTAVSAGTNSTSVVAATTAAITNAATADVALPPIKPPPDLPPPVAEVVQLAQRTIGDAVILSYIDNIEQPYMLNSDQVIYLADLGLSNEVIQALVKHGTGLSAPPANEPPVMEKPAEVAKTPPLVPNAPIAAPAAVAVPAPVAEYAVPPPSDEGADAPPATITNNYFYESLSPYGSWVDVAPYGWCWQPTVAVVSPSWRPYCDRGYWTWSDCGWYWNSHYSWGWAPFHYGNWYHGGSCGWVWAPGTTWAPAWVTWRYTDTHCGWAPLPPGCGWNAGVGLTFSGSHVSVGFGFGFGAEDYCFVPHGYMSHHNPRPYYVTGGAAGAAIYRNSSAVNNYARGNYNTIVNQGPGVELAQKHSKSEIRKVALQDAANPGAANHASIGGKSSSSLAVYRPTIPAQAATPPANVLHRQEALKVAPQRVGGATTVAGGSVQGPASGAGKRLEPAHRDVASPPTPTSGRNETALRGSASTSPIGAAGSPSRPVTPGSTGSRVTPSTSTANAVAPSRNEISKRSTTSPASETSGGRPGFPGNPPGTPIVNAPYAPGESIRPGVTRPGSTPITVQDNTAASGSGRITQTPANYSGAPARAEVRKVEPPAATTSYGRNPGYSVAMTERQETASAPAPAPRVYSVPPPTVTQRSYNQPMRPAPAPAYSVPSRAPSYSPPVYSSPVRQTPLSSPPPSSTTSHPAPSRGGGSQSSSTSSSSQGRQQGQPR